jgi:hypothetical protein
MEYEVALLEGLSTGDTHARPVVAHAADLEWARSGAMWLTGEADGPPALAPGPLATAASGAVSALARITGSDTLARLDGAALLGERAAIAGSARAGRISPGGSCRLLRTADGWLALNLARPEDEALLPALLRAEPTDAAPWCQLERELPARPTAEWVERGRLMSLPIAACAAPRATPPPWLRSERCANASSSPPPSRPLVVDLSSLWAGPLCAHLLMLAGARVVKVESQRRPDGARRGPPAFFDLLNAGKEMLALDFTDTADVRQLRALLERADIVVESARPRALKQIGVDSESILQSAPGLTWLGITGYGRRAPEADWVAFGDDAAVAAGLAALTGTPAARPLFCGDAIADPLAGTHAALAAWSSHRAGGGALLDVSLRDVTEHALGCLADAEPISAKSQLVLDPDSRVASARVRIGNDEQAVLPPRARAARGRAGTLGADNEALLRELSGGSA